MQKLLFVILALMLVAAFASSPAMAGAPNTYEQCAGRIAPARNECIVNAFKTFTVNPANTETLWSKITSADVQNYVSANPWLKNFADKVNKATPGILQEDIYKSLIVYNYIQGWNYAQDLKLAPGVQLPIYFWQAEFPNNSDNFRALFDISPSLFLRWYSDWSWCYNQAYVPTTLCAY
jgi:hypothetical protein